MGIYHGGDALWRVEPQGVAFEWRITINHCEFCVDINGATLQKRGASEEKILALRNWRDSTLFEPIERAALEYTEAVTYTDGRVTGEMMDELKRHFDDDAIVELTGLIAFQNMSSKFNAALDIPPQGFCQMPDLKTDADADAG